MRLETCKANTYIVRINKYIAFMPSDKYTQEVSMSHGGTRFYIDRGSAGGLSVSVKSCTVIACGIYFIDHEKTRIQKGDGF